MLETLAVKTQSGAYPITIHEGLLFKAGGDFLEPSPQVSRWVVITDENLANLYPEVIRRLTATIDDVIILPPGEHTKTLQRVEQVLEKMATLRLTRWDGLMAFGGGVVGDLTGFCASIYMRGISWVQIPTTLLAQVDSSVGGKTGVNLKSGKNLAGTFYPPQAVWIDPLFLNTLPDREFWGGCSEVIKYALIQGEPFQTWLVNQWEGVMDKEPVAMTRLIKKCIACKADIVAKDERETGLRKILNVGHTAGHAIEKLMQYQITHGEALRQGMLFELELAFNLGWINKNRYNQLISLVALLPVVTKIPAFPLEDLVQAMILDKKNRHQTISFLLPRQSSGKIEEIKLTGEVLIQSMKNNRQG